MPFINSFIKKPGEVALSSSYDSLQNVLDDIGTNLQNGSGWSIEWSGDPHVADGQVFGIIKNDLPVWVGILPITKVGLSYNLISGSVAYDADGRPVFTATGSNPAAISEIELDLEINPSSKFVIQGLYQTTGTPTQIGIAGAHAGINLASTPATRIYFGLAYVSGWTGFAAGIGNPFGPFANAPDFTTPKKIIMNLQSWINTSDLLPRAFVEISHNNNPYQKYDGGNTIGSGFVDWRSNLDLRMRFANADLGVPSTFTITGIGVEI